MSGTELIVSEIFGPTIQGEGPYTGRRAFFLRLGICNLKCTWCDTKYTWDWKNYDYKEELKRMSCEQINDKLSDLGAFSNPGLIVISGGEPMLQRHKLVELLTDWTFAYAPPIVQMETAGTVSPSDLGNYFPANYFVVSPKLNNSGNDLSKSIKPEIISEFNELALMDMACFKFVVAADKDVNEVLDFTEKFSISPCDVWLMPNTKKLTKDFSMMDYSTAERAIKYGFNYSDRLHVRIWGGDRGK